MEDCSFSCEESLGVCVSEDSPCDLKLNDYIALYLMQCSSNSNHQITLMGINGNPFVNAHTCLGH